MLNSSDLIQKTLKYEFTIQFPDFTYYHTECYGSKSLLVALPTTPFGYLSNYVNFAALLFLFTYSPDEDLNKDLTNKGYMLPKIITSWYKPFEAVASTPLLTSVTDTISCYSSYFDNTLRLHAFNSELLRTLVYTSVRKTNTADLSDLFSAYDDEITWFELYGQVKYCNQSLEEKDYPAVKLYYPEPFVATPSFIHEDVWFLHILRYAHWLWFFFISLIIIFFITFINTVRWCNYRVKPKRETRGVSRSKCADLITACVPVSWAISIIVSESTDAIDYYDGFGTGELVLGIRAYQWGWQYYYPKAIDTTYSALPVYSNLVGKSTLSVSSTSSNNASNHLWRHYQTSDLNNISNTATHVVLSPSVNSKITKFISLNQAGLNTLKSTDAFKKIQQFSKINNSTLFVETAHNISLYKKIKSLYLTDSKTSNSLSYGTNPQHTFIATGGSHRLNSPYLERDALKTYLDYTISGGSVWGSPTKPSTLAATNNKLLWDVASDNSLTFNVPNTYVDYDLTSFKHARQVETLYWESQLNLKHPTNPKKLFYNPTYESYYTAGLSYSGTSYSGLVEEVVPSTKHSFSEDSSVGLESRWVEKNNNNYYNYSRIEEGINDYIDLTWRNNNPAEDFGSFINCLNKAQNSNSVHLMNQYLCDTESGPCVFERLCASRYDTLSRGYNSLWVYDILSREYNSLWVDEVPSTKYGSLRFDKVPNMKYNSLWFDDNSLWLDEVPSTKYNSLWLDEVPSTKYSSLLFDEVPSTKSSSLVDEPRFSPLPTVPYAPTSTTRLLNPLLLNPNSYNLFFLKMFNTRWVGEYTTYKFWDTVNLLKSTRNLQPTINSLVPINLTTLLSYYPTTDVYNYAVGDSFGGHYSKNLLTYVPTHLNTFASRSRHSNNISLRSSAKESITSYNALRKVFKARFDEGRANLNFTNIVDLFVTAPLINMPQTPFEVLLQKNSSDFFSKVTYVPKLKNTFSGFFTLDSLLNFYITDLPFLKSLKSDASRYIWFDWGSRWEWLEVQPSSIARYSLLGVPYSRNQFLYNSGDNKASKLLNSSSMVEAENYFKRLSYSRKNYALNWIYSPYLYTRLLNSDPSHLTNHSNQLLLGLSNASTSSSLASGLWVSFRSVLNSGTFYWSAFNSIGQVSGNLSATTTPINTPGRSFSKPVVGNSYNNYSVNKTSYLLSKREGFYHQYLTANGYSYFLSPDIVNSPSNFFVSTVRSNTKFGDSSLFSPEGIRTFEVYRNASILPSFLNVICGRVLGVLDVDTLQHVDNIQKNQYRPMRKGITSMVRLHATNAVALPSEMRIHILASSKDVIHSWAIPSAGIKIDCVPGYSSHRIAIFLNSGIYWGQCMEICGRFHHWMPIVLYIMKRDAFFIWVTHFIHYDKNTGEFTNLSNMSYSEASRVVLNSSLFDYKLVL